jgi:membrane protease YdiL (CAAX protease family)
MNQPGYTGGRLRAYLQFLGALIYFFFARSLAFHGAEGLAGDAWFPLAEQAMLAFLLLVGFAALGFWLDRQIRPVSEQGLPRRQGWLREAGLGLATGWGLALVCVLPLMIVGGIAITVFMQTSAWGWLVADAAFFALAALAEEIAYRGYAFQCFVRAVGPVGATLGFAAIYAIVQALAPGSNRTSFIVSLAFSLLLSTAYLRTRALWVSWGLNFGWKASRALVFGLAVSGVIRPSCRAIPWDPSGSPAERLASTEAGWRAVFFFWRCRSSFASRAIWTSAITRRSLSLLESPSIWMLPRARSTRRPWARPRPQLPRLPRWCRLRRRPASQEQGTGNSPKFLADLPFLPCWS